jgi:hypothetical protein
VKKLLSISASFVLLPSLACAANMNTSVNTSSNAPASVNNPYGGIFLTGGLGFLSGRSEMVTKGALGGAEKTTTTDGPAAGLLVDGVAGYRYALNNWVFGGGLMASYTTAETKVDNNITIGNTLVDSSLKMTTDYTYGALFGLGHTFKGNLYGVFAGPTWSRVEFKDSGNNGGNGFSDKNDVTIYGTALGVSFEQPLCKNLSIGERITYTILSDKTLFKNSTNPLITSVKATSARAISADLALTYTFNV